MAMRWHNTNGYFFLDYQVTLMAVCPNGYSYADGYADIILYITAKYVGWFMYIKPMFFSNYLNVAINAYNIVSR